MSTNRTKIVVICGPTASGKSDIAIRLAKKFNGEIISADSRQVFRGMDIGTGKVSGALEKELETFVSEGVSHHMIDVADPMEDFNVSHFKKLAEIKISDIAGRGKIPIICGGTGFWISTLINNNILPEVKPDEELRKVLRNKTSEELFRELKKLDSRRAANIDPKNPVRLIRAIEIARALGKVPELSSAKKPQTEDKNLFLQIGIDVPREILNEKIKKRLDERFENGMIKETELLMKNGVSPVWLEKIGLEYRWLSRFLQDKIPQEEMKNKLYYDIIHYAKRQMTWFGKNKKIIWLNKYELIENEVRIFLEKK